MAATQISASLTSAAAPTSALASSKSALSGVSVTVQGLPPLSSTRTYRPLRIEANKVKKVNVKLPNGYSGDTKFRKGVDASGSKGKGKGTYQFTKKYGANVDGYSPIYAEEDWAKSGNSYAGGSTGLALWAVTFAGLLAAGAFLVYSTSALSS